LASTNESTRRQNPKEQHRHVHRRENLKSLWGYFSNSCNRLIIV
jgi:hypothetical protein